MATNKPRFSVTFTDESFEKIQKYQRQNNITTQSKAVAKLVEMAISDIESLSDAEASIGEKAHIKKYRLLDPYGKEAVDSILDIEHKRCTEAAMDRSHQASYRRAGRLQDGGRGGRGFHPPRGERRDS